MADTTPLLIAPAPPNRTDGRFVLSGIEKRWGDRVVLGSVNLSVSGGTVAAVTGGNGTGKTTLLRIAAGIIRPDAGSVALEGLDPVRDRRRYLARLGFLSAGDRGLYARLNARRHVELAARLALVAVGRRQVAVDRALQTFELHDFADRRVDRISMGQRQRVRLAMTFVHEPDVILLDEAPNSLDAEGLQILARAVERAASRGAAVVACLPEGDETPFPCDLRLRLTDGKLWQI